MSRILITGATGLLGKDLVQLAHDAGYDIRIMSRRPRPAAFAPDAAWVQGDLETGAGFSSRREHGARARGGQSHLAGVAATAVRREAGGCASLKSARQRFAFHHLG